LCGVSLNGPENRHAVLLARRFTTFHTTFSDTIPKDRSLKQKWESFRRLFFSWTIAMQIVPIEPKLVGTVHHQIRRSAALDQSVISQSEVRLPQVLH